MANESLGSGGSASNQAITSGDQSAGATPADDAVQQRMRELRGEA